MLTSGAVNRILRDQSTDPAVLQVINIKPLTVNGKPGVTRFRLTLWDNTSQVIAMLATNKNDYVTEKRITTGSVLKITEFMTNSLKDTVIIILLNFDLINDGTPANIQGNPQSNTSSSSVPPGSGAQNMQPNHQQPYGHQAQPQSNPYQQQQYQQQSSIPTNPYQRQAPPPNQPQVANPYANQSNPYQPHMPSNNNHEIRQDSFGQIVGNRGSNAAPSPSVYGQHGQPQVPPMVNPYQQQQPPAQSPYGQPQQQQQYGGNIPPYQQQQQQYQKPAYGQQSAYGAAPSAYGGARGSSGPISRGGGNDQVIPISALNPYTSRWTIKARITQKDDIKRWQNERGEGTLFKIHMMDKDENEIGGVFFKEACDKWYQVLELGKVYTFSGGKIKPGNPQYSVGQFEITFDNNTQIIPVNESDASASNIKSQTYKFVSIDSLPSVPENTTVDIIGYVKTAAEWNEITTKAGKTLQKRELEVVDKSNCMVRVTLWGDRATSNDYNWEACPIVAFKGCRVGSYGGRSLSASSVIQINPDLPEGHDLNAWRIQNAHLQPTSLTSSGGGGGNYIVDRLMKRRSIDDLKDGSRMSDAGIVGTVTAHVLYIPTERDPWYEACPRCHKKMTTGPGSQYQCEKCGQNYDDCERRYVLSMQVGDGTGTQWMTLFNETAEGFFGMTANELWQMKENDTNQFYGFVRSKYFQIVNIVAKSKYDMANDEQKLKTTVNKIEKLNYINESTDILDALDRYQ